MEREEGFFGSPSRPADAAGCVGEICAGAAAFKRVYLCGLIRNGKIRASMNVPPHISRRQLLHRCGMGMGALTLSTLLQDLSSQNLARAATLINPTTPLAARNSPFPARAKRVIHFFLNGGP